MKKETVDLFEINRLTDEQRAMPSYWVDGRRGYSLGQRCAAKGETRTDFGWDGAAGAYYFIDRSKGISAYLGTHILGLGEYFEKRGEITPIIQEIL